MENVTAIEGAANVMRDCDRPVCDPQVVLKRSSIFDK